MSFGATILDADGLRLTADERAFFRDSDPFGFILFARNIEDAAQVRALCAEMREAVGRDAPITIDQEGGRVQRLRPPLARAWAPPLDFVEVAGDAAPRAMYLRYRLIAAELRALGIDSNCAPIADLANPATHEFLRNRCYGDDPVTVALLGRAVAEGHLDGGVLPVLKHIPGHGRAQADSHLDLPVVTAPLAELEATDFEAFRQLNDLPLGMTGHLVFSSIDDAPATLSGPTIDMVREAIGFDGLLMTDDIGMRALSGEPAALASQAIAAGCDLVLSCNAPVADRIAIASAAGQMSSAAQTRAERALAQRKEPDDIDIAELNAELETLLSGRGND